MKNNIIIITVIAVIAIGGIIIFRMQGEGTSPTDSLTNSQNGGAAPKEAAVSGSFVRGQKAPEVSFADFEGNSHRLADFEGQAVVLDFWAKWCPFCTGEMPELQKAQDKYQDELVMIGVHRTNTESVKTGQKFAVDKNISYRLVTDPDDSLYRATGGVGMPVAVFIDKDGVVSEIKSGPKTVSEIEEKVGALVK